MDKDRVKKVIAALIVGTLLPVVDVFTDLYTSISLYVDGHPIWGSLILTFMWTPSILFILNKKFLPHGLQGVIPTIVPFEDERPTTHSLAAAFAIVLFWPFYSIANIVLNFYLFVSGKHEDFDQTQIVEEIKLAETCFEAAPQAVMQLYLAFSFAVGKEPGLTLAQGFKGLSIAMSILSLSALSIKVTDKKTIESGLHKNKILRLIHTCSTIMASIVLWGALAFYLEAWIFVALALCYVSTYFLNILGQKLSNFESEFRDGTIDWFGMPPFYWVSAYLIGFLLPRRQKIASILGTALTLAIFCTLIQKCVIPVDPAKYMDSSNATGINPGSCMSEETGLLWAPFMFVGLWLIIDLCTFVSPCYGLEYIAQIIFSLMLIITILAMI